MVRRVLLAAVLAAAFLVYPVPEARAADPLRVLLPADANTYFEISLPASIGLSDPVQPATLVVTLDGFDITADFTLGIGGATAALEDLTPGPHVLEATATGEIFDPFLFEFVTETFTATSAFSVDTAFTAWDFIDLGIDYISRRDLPSARDAFFQATRLDRKNQPAALLLALTRIAILLDPTLPGANPWVLDSAGEFLDALGFPPEGRDLFDWMAMLPTDAAGNVVLPPTAPRAPEVQRFGDKDLLPRIRAAQALLRRIKKNFVYQFPADRLGAGLTPVEVDLGDVKVLLGALYLADAAICVGNSYNLDPGATDVLVQKINDRTLDVQEEVILANPDLLRLVSTKDLRKIKRVTYLGIRNLQEGLKAIDAETDPQNDDLLVIAPEQQPLEEKTKEFLQAVQKSLSRETLIPDVRYDPSDPNDMDWSMVMYLGTFFDRNGLDLRPLLPQFSRRPGGENVVLSRTFPDPTFGGLAPDLTQTELIYWTDQIAPDIAAESTDFPTDPNLFHITGSVVEEDLAAGLDLSSWRVTLRLYDASGQPEGGGVYDVTSYFPLSAQPDGTMTFDSFIRFVEPFANLAILTFEATDLNGNRRKYNLNLDLIAAVFLDPSSAHPVDPIHLGDGLSGHYVRTGTVTEGCTAPSPDETELLASLQAGDPGVVSVIDQPVTTELNISTSNGRFPNFVPGVARFSGFLRVDSPTMLDFRVSQGCGATVRLKVGGRPIIDIASGSGRRTRAVSFPVAGFYAFEVIFGSNYSYPRLQIQMASGAGGSAQNGTPYVPPTILYQTLDTDGDGATDSVETASGLDPNDPNDLDTDTDGDGLTGREELAIGTNAGNPDSDGDTLGDGEEVVPGADGFVTDPTKPDTDGDGRPDQTDPIPLLAQAELTVATPVVRPAASSVTVQLRLRDGTPVAKAGVPFRLTTSGSARFAAAATEGTVTSGGGTTSVNVQTSALGRVTIDLTDTVAQTVNVYFYDNPGVGIDGQLLYSDFESDDGGFAQVEGSLWELGTPTVGPEAAASGLNAWWINPDGVYAYTSTIESGPIATPSAYISGGVRTRFNHYLDRGYGRVQTRFEPSGSPSNIVTFSSATEGYVSQVTSLTTSTNSTFHLRFSFQRYSSAYFGSWGVDDVQVYLPGANVTQVEFQ
jgi:hypothetical protein